MEISLLIEALEIAVNNFDYDGEYLKAAKVRNHIDTLMVSAGA